MERRIRRFTPESATKRAERLFDLAARADIASRPEVREQAERIFGKIIKNLLRGRIGDDIIDNIGRVEILNRANNTQTEENNVQ